MKNAGKIDKSRDHAILSYSMVSVFTVIACILTVYHSLLRPNPLRNRADLDRRRRSRGVRRGVDDGVGRLAFRQRR